MGECQRTIKGPHWGHPLAAKNAFCFPNIELSISLFLAMAQEKLEMGGVVVVVEENEVDESPYNLPRQVLFSFI